MEATTRNKLVQVMTNLMEDIGDLSNIYEKRNWKLNVQLETFYWLLNNRW